MYWWLGLKRRTWPPIAVTPVSLAIFTRLSASSTRVGDRNFDQHVLAGAHHLLALAEVHLGRRGQDHRVGALDAFAEIAGVMRDAVFLGDRGGGILIAADQRGDFNALDALERIEMLLAERALAGDTDFHGFPLYLADVNSQRHSRARAQPSAGIHDLQSIFSAVAMDSGSPLRGVRNDRRWRHLLAANAMDFLARGGALHLARASAGFFAVFFLRFSRMMWPTAVLDAGTV